MIYAQIKNGIVLNLIILRDVSLKSVFGPELGFDAFIRVDQLIPRPQIGWIYNSDSQQFSAPSEEA